MLKWHSVPKDVFYQLRGLGFPANVKHWHYGDHTMVSYQVFGTSDDVQKFWLGW